MDLAVGFAIHTGWAIAVMAAGTGRAPVVLDRRRVALIPDDVERFVYHDVKDLPLAKAAARVASTHEAVDRTTDEAMAELAGIASEHGTLVAIGITGAPREVPELEKVLRSHQLLHLAEGEMYRGALCDAADARNLPVLPVHPKHGIAETATLLGVSPEHFTARLVALREQLGAPWQSDHKLATAAALAALHVAG